MNAQDRLRQTINRHLSQLRTRVPPDREAAILAVIRAQDRVLRAAGNAPPDFDLITGRRLTNLGGSRALQLCLEHPEEDASAPVQSGDTLDGWAERLLQACAAAAEAELVLAHSETGFMKLAIAGNGAWDAWIATKRAPASWRERADIDWWAASLSRRHESELLSLRANHPDSRADAVVADAFYLRLASVHVEMMAYQLGYPPGAAIGGCTIETYRALVIRLITWALQARDRGQLIEPLPEPAVVAALASALDVDLAIVGQALAAFTLDRENAEWHAAVPGVAAAPLVRVGSDRIVFSLYGLLTEPFFFLTRELRRREAPAYHNSAHLREGVFRHDLYSLFQDTRFVTSAGRVRLQREGGDLRTDVDAVIFDRKSGALGLFELKSQDPFVRSTAELARQRDTVLYANRQLSGTLDWLKRHGADDLLGRVDARAARIFRVQKVYPFVLGRYLVHFHDGPEPDRRAAWGTWPQVLRALDGASGANPLASLFTRLKTDTPPLQPPADTPPREIPLGAGRLTVYPSYAALRASAATERP